MTDSVSALALDLSRAALQRQETVLSDLRARAGTLLAAASIASSLLAGKGGEMTAVAISAIGFYVLAVAAAIYVLLPHQLVVDVCGSRLHDLDLGRADPIQAVYEAVTGWIESFYALNLATLDRLSRWYRASCIALSIEVVLWTVSVTSSL